VRGNTVYVNGKVVGERGYGRQSVSVPAARARRHREMT